MRAPVGVWEMEDDETGDEEVWNVEGVASEAGWMVEIVCDWKVWSKEMKCRK